MTVGLSLGERRWRLIRRGDSVKAWLLASAEDSIYVRGDADGAAFQDDARTTPADVGDLVGGLADLSGNDHHASQPTAAKRPLRTSSGLLLDGVDDFIYAPSGSLVVGGAVTICASVRMPAGYTSGCWIVSCRSSSVIGYEMLANSGKLGLFSGTSAGFSAPVGSALINDGAWHVVTARINIPAGTAQGYVDGALDRQTASAESGDMNPGGRIAIGATGDFAFGQNQWPGDIGAVVIVAAALSDQDKSMIEHRLADRVGFTLP